MRNYIFDLDGTIIDSSQEILDCIDMSLKINNLTVDKNKLIPEIIGPPITKIVKGLLPELQDEELIKQIMTSFRNIYDNKKEYTSRLYSGILDVLKNLKLSDKRLYIATNKPLKPTFKLLEKLSLTEFFDDIYTIDRFEKNMSKYEMIIKIIQNNKLRKSETIMIGDSLNDILAAKQAGIKSIGVLWGYGAEKKELIEMSDYTVKEPFELQCQKLSYQTI